MSKGTRNLLLSILAPLAVAVAGWIDAHSRALEAQRETLAMSDSFQEYIEYVMEQRGCEP